MKNYGQEMKGIFLLEPVASLPVWTAADEKRIVYNESDDKVYFGDATSWALFASDIGSVAADPHGNAAHSTPFADNPHGNAQHSSTFITSSGVTKPNLDANGDVGTGSGQVAQGDHGHASLADNPHGNAQHSSTFITSSGVTKPNLDANGDVGTGSGQVAQGDHTHATAPAGSVGQTELKTSSQEQSQSIGAGSSHKFSLTGGQFIFYPQMKVAGGPFASSAMILGTNGGGSSGLGSSYASSIQISNHEISSKVYYVKQTYVTASGEVNWLFILRDKVSKEIIGVSFAPDHPCFGSDAGPGDMPHPYQDYDEAEQEIFLITPTQENVELWSADPRGICGVIMEDYEIDDSVSPPWPTDPVTIGLPPGAEHLPWGTPITPVKEVIPQPDDVTMAELVLK